MIITHRAETESRLILADVKLKRLCSFSRKICRPKTNIMGNMRVTISYHYGVNLYIMGNMRLTTSYHHEVNLYIMGNMRLTTSYHHEVNLNFMGKYEINHQLPS